MGDTSSRRRPACRGASRVAPNFVASMRRGRRGCSSGKSRRRSRVPGRNSCHAATSESACAAESFSVMSSMRERRGEGVRRTQVGPGVSTPGVVLAGAGCSTTVLRSRLRRRFLSLSAASSGGAGIEAQDASRSRWRSVSSSLEFDAHVESEKGTMTSRSRHIGVVVSAVSRFIERSSEMSVFSPSGGRPHVRRRSAGCRATGDDDAESRLRRQLLRRLRRKVAE